MYRLVGFAVVATAIYVSCYQPTFRDCEIACTAQSGCPDGLACDTNAGRCALNGACGGPGDGGFKDAPGSGSGSGSNGCWPYAPTNYMPCNGSLPNAATFSSGTTTVMDTGVASCSYGPNGDVCLMHFTSMDITAALHVMGPRPLIIVSDGDITVRAAVTYDGSVGSGGPNCNAQQPGLGTHVGAGGGGGGYGGGGAPGGAGMGVNGGSGGMAFGSGALDPLFPGCPGAAGGSGSGAGGGTGGFGGGGIELSAKGNLTVTATGVVSADGGGGTGGTGIGSGNLGGGGGGGAGGAVLLEAGFVTVNGSVCAVGGGGGEGGFGTTFGTAGDAGSGCTRGSGGGQNVGAGGAGAGSGNPAPGTPGGSAIAGGGGGGGVGRTRIHSPLQTPMTGGSTIVPMPVTQ